MKIEKWKGTEDFNGNRFSKFKKFKNFIRLHYDYKKKLCTPKDLMVSDQSTFVCDVKDEISYYEIVNRVPLFQWGELHKQRLDKASTSRGVGGGALLLKTVNTSERLLLEPENSRGAQAPKTPLLSWCW